MSKEVSAITEGIKITVTSHFHPELSNPGKEKYVHSYFVNIENQSTIEVQLMTRHWIIYESDSRIREVKGPGVIGLQPSLSAGQSHSYKSWCPLGTPIGKMRGTYQFQRKLDNSHFNAEIPEFKLIASFKNN